MSLPIPMAILPDALDPNDPSSHSVATTDEAPQVQHSSSARASPIPSQVTPGYIPGMPRPMTPRDDIEERSHSTTPRATSPTHGHTHSSSFMASTTSSFAATGSGMSSFNGSGSLAASLLRRELSNRGSGSPRSGSPMYQRAGDGADNTTQHSSNPSYSSTYSSNSWRRPASPLSGQAYQPFSNAVSAPDLSRTPRPTDETSPPRQSTSSRPETSSAFSHASKSAWAHHRDASWTTSEEVHAQQNGSAGDQHGSASTRSLRSPALPDSPLLEAIHSLHAVTRGMASPPPFDTRPMSPMSLGGGGGAGGPAHSPNASLAFDSKRSSRQNHPNSPYSNGMFSPISGSSRSSLESSGSSYHSSECDGRDKVWEVFGDTDEAREPKWHDIPEGTPQDGARGAGVEDDEAIVQRIAGLTKADFAKIQDRLVEASSMRQTSVADHKERAASLRKRRPSTAHSNYSYKDVVRAATSASPPQSPTIASQRPSDDDIDYEANARANALLNSVVDSIRTTGPLSPPPTSPPSGPLPAQPRQTQPLNATRKEAPPSLTIPQIGNARDLSPATRRNRDLAHLLFGAGEEAAEQDEDQGQQITMHAPRQPSDASTPGIDPQTPATFPMLSPKEHPPITPLTAGGPYRLRNPSTPRIPQTPEEEEELTREVQRKADAAMAALRKSPSATNLAANVQNAPPNGTRKRISPHQISTPKLVSASTSVDAISLNSPGLPPGHQGTTSSKIGMRLKRLRGTLRGKAPVLPTGEEVTPFTLGAPPSAATPPPPTFRLDPSPPQTQASTPAESTHDSTGGATGLSKSASGRGSGFKGLFMSRLRSKSRAGDNTPDLDRREVSQPMHSATASMSAMSALNFGDNRMRTANENAYSAPLHSAPLLSRPYAEEQDNGLRDASTSSNEPSSTEDQSSRGSDVQALRQLFDAASNLGLDPDALGELLKRSGSTSSKAPRKWMSRSNSVSTAFESRPSTTMESRSIPDIARDSPVPEEASTSTSPEPMHRSMSRKRQARPSMEDTRKSTVVRRTIIFPSSTRMSNFDLGSLMKTPKGRKRASTSSVLSNRSVQDRAPTPPPPRASMARHGSMDEPPPVPTLPPSLSSPTQETFLAVPPARPSVSGDQSNAEAYDAFYDMYSGEARQTPTSEPDPNNSGPGVEVIELANGEMIWSIVDGLRDDDRESLYTGRASFASEYSVGGDSMQVTFKERGQGSKRQSIRNSSMSAFGSSLKPPAAAGANRPETKVFYSSTAQIGRLIEQLANSGSDAGAFNFAQNTHGQMQLQSQPQSHSSSFMSSTDSNWTVEERLEHMLGSMRPV